MAKRKRSNYRFWHSPIALLALFVFFVVFAYNVLGLIKKAKETAYKKDLIIEKIDNLKNKEADLSRDISKLKTEEGEEEIIRDKYQVAKSGEKMVIIVDEDRENLKLDNSDYNKKHGFVNWFNNIFKE